MKKYALALSLLSLTAVSIASAQMPAEPVKEGDWMVLRIGDDLYVSGEGGTFERDVGDDLIIAGGNVSVTGQVNGDILAAGGQVDVSGPVNEDIRAAGGNITIRSTINGDVVVMGGTIIVEENAIVRGDIVAMGGTVDIRGRVQGSARIRGGQVSIVGSIGRGLDIAGGSVIMSGESIGNTKIVSESITIAQGASFLQNVEYWSEEGQVNFSAALRNGAKATYNADLAHMQRDAGKAAGALGALIGVWTIFCLLSSSLIVIVLMLLYPTFFKKTSEKMAKSPWYSMLWGFLFFAATPVLMVLCFITIIGIPLGLIVLMYYLLTLFLAAALVSMVFARYIETYFKQKWHPVILFLVTMGVFIVLKMLWIIPVLGWIVKMVLIFTGIGAIISTKWALAKKIR